MTKAIKKFRKYIDEKNLQITRQRMDIAEVFLQSGRHLSVDELYELLKEREISAGRATVFRTLKLLNESGVAGEVDLGEKTRRYEVKFGNTHHDHLVCTGCGRYIEVYSGQIEEMQEKLCAEHGFKPSSHRLDIFGLCRSCGIEKKKKGYR